jgi:hypothetical protein
MPRELTPTHRCKFKLNGGWRGGEIIYHDAMVGRAVVLDKLTGIPWLLEVSEVLVKQPIEAKRNEEGVVHVSSD